jgi:hypothetical protein
MLTLVKCDDWLAIYVDGVAQYQGHSIDYSELLNLAGVPHSSKWAMDWMDEAGLGWFPEKLEDIAFFDE